MGIFLMERGYNEKKQSRTPMYPPTPFPLLLEGPNLLYFHSVPILCTFTLLDALKTGLKHPPVRNT